MAKRVCVCKWCGRQFEGGVMMCPDYCSEKCKSEAKR